MLVCNSKTGEKITVGIHENMQLQIGYSIARRVIMLECMSDIKFKLI